MRRFFSRLHATNHQGNCVVFVSLYSRLLKQQRVATFWLQIRVKENRAADAQLLLLLLIWAIWSINHLNQFPFDARFPIHYWPHALREWEFFFTSHWNCRLLSLAFFLLSYVSRSCRHFVRLFFPWRFMAAYKLPGPPHIAVALNLTMILWMRLLSTMLRCCSGLNANFVYTIFAWIFLLLLA